MFLRLCCDASRAGPSGMNLVVLDDGPDTVFDPRAATFASWASVPQAIRRPDGTLPAAWKGIFEPLRQGTVDDLLVIAQCGQSIDARIATASGHSHYVNGEAGLAHLHRLRAVVDAVVIGVGTAI